MGGGLLQWPQDSLQEEPWFFPRHSDGEMGAGWNWELLFCQLAPGGSDILKLTLQFAGGVYRGWGGPRGAHSKPALALRF